MSTLLMSNGLREWNFSLDRQATFNLTHLKDKVTGQFRWRLENGNYWLCDQLQGQADFISCDNQKHRWQLKCELWMSGIKEGNRFAFVKASKEYLILNGSMIDSLLFKNSYWRVDCELKQKKWRLTDMENDQEYIVKSLEGRINMSCYNGETQVFHSGPILIGEDNIAYFYTGDMLYGKSKT